MKDQYAAEIASALRSVANGLFYIAIAIYSLAMMTMCSGTMHH